MHKDTIDWFREIHLSADKATAEKRWATAAKIGENIGRRRVVDLLKLCLLASSPPEEIAAFTSDIKDLDVEFKGTDNVPEVRLMAGLVMVTTFAKSSHAADAFALGIRAANFPPARIQPVQAAVIGEAEKYLLSEASRLRPDEFVNDTVQVTNQLVERKKAFVDAVASGDPAKETPAFEAYHNAVVETIAESYSSLADRIQQLAEESGLLWWVLNGYSELLQKPVVELTGQEYALAAALEAAKRTSIVPPPPSIGPLLVKALDSCKKSKKQPLLSDYIEATSQAWRVSLLKGLPVADCRDLVRICAALERLQELGDSGAAFKALGDMPLTPSHAAEQLYTEILFLRALASTKPD